MSSERVLIPEVVFLQEGPGVRKNQYTQSGVKLLNVANLVEGKVDLSTSDRYISKEEAYGKYKHFLVDEGDLIIASSGIKVEYFEKKMGFVDKSQLPLCMNTSTIRFKSLDENKLNIRYFMYFLKSSDFKRQLFKQITGSAQLNFGPSHLSKMTLPLFDIKTQAKIYKKLDKIVTVIDTRKQQLEQLDLLIKSRFVEMFGDVDLTMNKNEWIEIKHIGTVVSGATPKTIINEYWNGDFNWFTPAELSNNSGYIFESERKISQEGVDSCSLQKLPVNTVLLTSRAPIGKLAIAGTECYCNQGFKNIICGTKVLPRYLYYLLLFNTEFLNSLGRGATFKEISKSIVENIKIPLPPIELQNEFARFVEQVEETKTQVQKSLDEAQLLFNSLMQEYFG